MCIDLHIADVPYTYINNYTGNTSRIDHFLVCNVLSECVSECCIIDNHRYSDHVSLTITFDIEVDHAKLLIRPLEKRQHGSKQMKMIYSHIDKELMIKFLILI